MCQVEDILKNFCFLGYCSVRSSFEVCCGLETMNFYRIKAYLLCCVEILYFCRIEVYCVVVFPFKSWARCGAVCC